MESLNGKENEIKGDLDIHRARVWFYTVEENVRRFIVYQNKTDGKKFRVLHGKIAESECYSFILTAARLMITKLSSQINPIHFTEEKQIPVGQQPTHWMDIHRNGNYYDIHDVLFHSPMYHDDNRREISLFIEVKPVFLKNLNSIENIEAIQHTYSELLENKDEFLDLKTLQFLKNNALDPQLDSQIKVGEQKPSRDNTYLLFCNKPPGIDKFHPENPYMPIIAVLMGIFRRKDEKWLLFNSGTNDYPSEETLDNSRAIIIPGSRASAYQNDDWVKNFRVWIQEIYQKQTHLQFLGICFGHQILAHSLGGEVSFFEERKTNPFYIRTGIDRINFKEKYLQIPFVKNAKISNEKRQHCNISKAHGDIVIQTPSNFRVLANNDVVENESMISLDGRCFSVQGHPEYSSEFIIRKGAEYQSWTKQFLQNREEVLNLENNVIRPQYNIPNDDLNLREVFRSFLHSDIQDLTEIFKE